jgi:hypothetical protein
MTSLHQRLNQENVHEREGAVEALQSRWSSGCRAIVDKPPSHPPTRRQLGGRPSSGSLKESHDKDADTGSSRRGRAVGRCQRSNSKWDSSSADITDSPPLQPCRCLGRKTLSKPPLTRHRPRHSFVRGQILQTLIVQGLIKIEENDEIDEEIEVTVFCYSEDEATVKKVLPDAVKEYVKIMQQESTVLLELVVSVNADGSKDLTGESCGGIALTGDRFFRSYRTIDDGERRGGLSSCA